MSRDLPPLVGVRSHRDSSRNAAFAHHDGAAAPQWRIAPGIAAAAASPLDNDRAGNLRPRKTGTIIGGTSHSCSFEHDHKEMASDGARFMAATLS
jgi:hypothetical protein